MRQLLIVIFVSWVVGVACTDQEFGDGWGRPSSNPSVRPTSPIQITEVFLAHQDTGERFVELAAADTATESLDLDGYQLCSATQCEALTGTLTVSTRRVESLTNLDLLASASDLAVVDPDGVVAAYRAWGIAPLLQGSTIAAQALSAGQAVASDFVPLPFPMPGGIALAWEDDGAGCAQPSAGAPATIDPALCPVGESPLQITEVLPHLAPDGPSWIEIKNQIDEVLPLFGVRICQAEACVQLGRDVSVAGLDRLLVHLGVAAPTPPSDHEIFFPTARPAAPNSEIALFAPGDGELLTDSEQMLSYVRYGMDSSPQLLTKAVAADLWPTTEDWAWPPRVAGESLSRGPRATAPDLPWSSMDPPWNPSFPPTPLLANPDLGPDLDTWTSCSYVRPWRAVAPANLAIQAIDLLPPIAITLINRREDLSPEPLAGWRVAVGAATLDLTGQPDLAAGQTLIIELSSEPDGCAQEHLCWDDPAAQLTGEVSLLQSDPSGLAQHLQWGEESHSQADNAVAAGVWPLAECVIPVTAETSRIELEDGTSGHSPPDYHPLSSP